MQRIENVLDELNVKYDFSGNYGLVEFWTDTAGQDMPVEIDFDGTPEDFVNQFAEYADNYNVDDEVELYVNMRGQKGVPATIRELLDDCQEAKDTLTEIANRLNQALKGERV